MGKRKAKGRKAPLSSLDKFIYVFVGVLSVALVILGMVLFAVWIPSWITYADSTVIAYKSSEALVLTSFLFAMVFFSPAVGFSIYWYEKKQPIFGNKHFKARFSAPLIPTYPLFSQKYFESLDIKYKKKVKTLMTVWAISSAVCLLFVLFTLCPRTVLHENGTLKKHNAFNEITHTCNISSADSVEFSVNRHSSTKGRTYYSLTLCYDFGDHTHSFSTNSFEKMTTKETLEYYLEQKDRFGDEYRLQGVEYLDKFVKDDKLNSEEKSLLYALFDKAIP